MTTISLDGISSSSIPELVIEDVTRQITPAIRDSYRDVPGRSGSWLFEEEAGDRGLSVRFAAVGETLAARREAVREAGAWLYGDGLGRRKLIVSDEPDRFVWAKLSNVVESEELLARGRFSASFRTSPFALSTAISSETLTGSDSIVLPTTGGLAAYFEPSIEVTSTGANPDGFSIDVGGIELAYGAAFPAASVVTLSAISSTVTTGADADTELDGTFDGSALAMTSVSGDFPILRPGTNVVTITGSVSAVFRWRERFV